MRPPPTPAAALCLAALAAATGCGGGGTEPDGGLLDCAAFDDATPDGATGGACGGDVDPTEFWPTRNGVFVSVNDLRAVGLSASAVDAQLVVRPGETGAPAAVGGDCAQFPAALTGDSARNASADDDLGFAETAECEGRIAFGYESNEGRYRADALAPGTLAAEFPVVARFTGADGNLFDAASVPFPPPSTYAQDPFHRLDNLSTVADNEVTFTSPYATDEARGLTAVVVLFDPEDASHTTVCAVPACRQRVHIPAALVAAFGAGGSYLYGRGFARSVPFTVAGRALRLVASSYAVGHGIAQ